MVMSHGGPKVGEVIAKIAYSENATLVVIGSRGISPIKKSMLGGVADHVVKHCLRPVIVCKHPNTHKYDDLRKFKLDDLPWQP